MPHHTRDDWNWKRLPDGSVQVFNTRLGVQHKMKPNEWASVVSSVSAAGENADTFQAALKAHMDEPEHEVEREPMSDATAKGRIGDTEV